MSLPDAGANSQDDHELHAISSRFNIDVLEEASYILWSVWKTIFPRYSTLSACIDALKESGELYTELKTSHRLRCYDGIRNWGFSCEQSFSGILVQPHRVEDAVPAFLASLKPNMVLLFRGELTLPVWTPPASFSSHLSSQTISHLTSLRLPCLRGKPNVLLHELGYFSQEPELQKRVQNVFMPASPSHTILVNTSGSGKTRLLFEGLCQNWGLYFTSFVDSSFLGSVDIQKAIQTTLPNDPHFSAMLPSNTEPEYKSKVTWNEKIATGVFKRVFLSRVLIFNLFIEVMNRADDILSTEECRRRWLLLQLQPSILHRKIWDAFDALTQKLAICSDNYVDATTRETLNRIRDTLSPSTTTSASTSTSTSRNTPLYCVIDEAQFAATQHTTAFRSSPKDAKPRPVLRPLIQSLSKLTLGHGVFFILAGTGLSQSSIDATMASAVMKESRYRWCSDTGAFEGWEGMSSWVGRFVPNCLFDGLRGSRLRERMGYWLTGRHRFAAGYVTELLANGFRQPHRLLNAYIRQFTGFEPTDGREAAEEEELESLETLTLETRYRLDFNKLAKNNDMMTTIHHLVTHYHMRSILPGPLGSDESLFVEYGFARIKHTEGEPSSRNRSKSKTIPMSAAIDEPLVLLAAHHWIDHHYISSYKYFTRHIRMHCPSSSDGSAAPSNGFENFIVHCIDLLFAIKPRRLKDVFEFYGRVPLWANLQAEVVSLYALPVTSSSPAGKTAAVIEQGIVKHGRFSGPSATLGTNAKTPAATLEWLAHDLRAPICFPCTAMGPDVMFVLRLADGKLIWVALQAKLSVGRNGKLDKKLIKSAVRSVTPKYFFLNKEGNPFSPIAHPRLTEDTCHRLQALPNKCEDHEAGTYSLLRVITSFPARADLGRCIDEKDLESGLDLEDTEDGHPIAILNMELVKEVTKNLSPVNFLESLEPKKSGRNGKKLVGRKRKQSAGASTSGGSGTKKRKIKL
ncbi:hypothetical protein AX15_000451 [Amanita polypyramis BW_CC]|nr:hypothetical protein AX15_000451 [Amanita polypyramis BW_CC]